MLLIFSLFSWSRLGGLPTISILLAALVWAVTAREGRAHGIAGNRLFAGTLTFDDPAITDELVLPDFTRLTHRADGGGVVTDYVVGGGFARLLTPNLSFGADSAWIERHRAGSPSQSGFDATTVSLKASTYEDDPHETLAAARLGWRIPHSGQARVDGDAPGALAPGFFFGKGFGDLPDRLSFLRPFAIAGGVEAEFPTGNTNDPNLINWAFAIEFSPLYLTDRFTGGPPKEEPLNQLVPLVEFAFTTPFGGGSSGKTTATMNPGFAYAFDNSQIAAEAIVPLNHETGQGVGFHVQLLMFLDDLVPALFGEPVFGR
jgi:hypothetical protein